MDMFFASILAELMFFFPVAVVIWDLVKGEGK